MCVTTSGDFSACIYRCIVSENRTTPLFCLGSSPTNNPVTCCIQTNELHLNVVGFENLFHSENLFKMADCSTKKRVVVSIEKRINALKRMDKGERLESTASSFGVCESTVCD